MTRVITCRCGKMLRIDQELQGKKLRCPSCKDIIDTGTASTATSQPSASPTARTPQPTQNPRNESTQPPAQSQPDPFADALLGQPPVNVHSQASGAQYGPSSYSQPQVAPGSAWQGHQKKSSNTAMIVGVCIAIALLLGGGLITSLVVFASGQDNESSADADSIGEIGPNVASGNTTARSSALTEEECVAAATRFTSALERGDSAGARGFLNYEELIRRATDSVDAPAQMRAGFMKGFLESANTGRLESQMVLTAGEDAAFRVLRAHRVGAEMRVWIRISSDAIGVNYQDIVFFADENQQPKAADIYNITSGELISQTMRRVYVMAVASQNRSLLQRLSNNDSAFVEHMQDFQQMSQLKQTDPAAALSIYKRLPKSLRENKILLLLRIQAAVDVNEPEYMAAMNDFNRLFPNDPAGEVMALDWHFLREEYELALDAVNALDRIVGGDPYLDTYRANIHLQKGDYVKAAQFAEAVMENEPTLQDAYWTRITIALAENNHADALKFMKKIDSSFDLEWGNLHEIPEYSDFAQSAEHQQWTQYLRER